MPKREKTPSPERLMTPLSLLANLAIVGGMYVFIYKGWRGDSLFETSARWTMIAIILISTIRIIGKFSGPAHGKSAEERLAMIIVGPLIIMFLSKIFVALIPDNVERLLGTFHCIEIRYRNVGCSDCRPHTTRYYVRMPDDSLTRPNVEKLMAQEKQELIEFNSDYTMLEETAIYIGYLPKKSTNALMETIWNQRTLSTLLNSSIVVLEVIIWSILFIFTPTILVTTVLYAYNREPISNLWRPQQLFP